MEPKDYRFAVYYVLILYLVSLGFFMALLYLTQQNGSNI